MTDPRAGRGRHEPNDERELEQMVGLRLVARLHGLLRAVRIYDMSNQAVTDQLHQTLGLVTELMQDEVTLVAMGQCFYVNGTRVRAEPTHIPLFDALSKEFEQRRLGGLRFLDGVAADELAAFMRLMVNHADAVRGPQLGDATAGAGVVHVVPITLEELESVAGELAESQDRTGQSERDRAHRTFRQALVGAKATIMRTARTGRPAIRRAKRVVQPIVDSIMKNEYSIVGLTAIKSHDEYTYAHCVNVSILSIAIGQELGLSRGRLANLGVAALLHDVGKLSIPVDVLTKAGQLTDEDWRLMRRHPLEGVKSVMRMPGLSTLMTDALDVCLYHHRRADGKGYPKIERSGPLPAMARIVSVADCYDAMTTHRAYRARPFTGYEALQVLLGPDREAFDPAALWALIQTVGLYPAGTLLQTESGHVVLSLSNDRADLRRPHCRVLSYPDGRQALEGFPDLWEPMPAHERVTRVVSPEDFEAEIDQLLAA